MASMRRTMARAMERLANPRPSVGSRKRAMREEILKAMATADHDPDQPEQPARDSQAYRFEKWLARMGKGPHPVRR